MIPAVIVIGLLILLSITIVKVGYIGIVENGVEMTDHVEVTAIEVGEDEDIIKFVHANEPTTTAEVADAVGQSRSYVLSRLRRLEGKGTLARIDADGAIRWELERG